MERITGFRAAVLLLAFLVVVGFFAFKLYDVQIVEAMTDYELKLAERKTLETRLKCLK